MRKFRSVVESVTPPPTDCLWINNKDVKCFVNGEWIPLVSDEDNKELEIGDSTEVKARNLEKLKKVEHTFLADINHGYGTANWLPATGGQAIITTAAGGQVYYSISKDGAVIKIAENTNNVITIDFTETNFLVLTKEVYDILKESQQCFAILSDTSYLLHKKDNSTFYGIENITSKNATYYTIKLVTFDNYYEADFDETTIKFASSSPSVNEPVFIRLTSSDYLTSGKLDILDILGYFDDKTSTSDILFAIPNNEEMVNETYGNIKILSYIRDVTGYLVISAIVTTKDGKSYLNNIISNDGNITSNVIELGGIASKTSPGLVKACTNIADVTDSANLMGAFNNLLKQMRAAGMMIS